MHSVLAEDSSSVPQMSPRCGVPQAWRGAFDSRDRCVEVPAGSMERCREDEPSTQGTTGRSAAMEGRGRDPTTPWLLRYRGCPRSARQQCGMAWTATVAASLSSDVSPLSVKCGSARSGDQPPGPALESAVSSVRRWKKSAMWFDLVGGNLFMTLRFPERSDPLRHLGISGGAVGRFADLEFDSWSIRAPDVVPRTSCAPPVSRAAVALHRHVLGPSRVRQAEEKVR